jgi:hypothetical protein
MEYYEKNYEDVFSSERSLKKCPLDEIEIKDLTLKDYQETYRKFLTEAFDFFFLAIVRQTWLRRHFGKNGQYLAKSQSNRHDLDRAYSIFLRQYVGKDFRILSRWFASYRVASYFDDFFPEFMERNPFEEPNYFRLPYSHVSIDFLVVVYQMTERLELLEKAEKDKMNYNVFLDYVINHSLSYNDSCGEDKYIPMVPDSQCPPYIKNLELPINKPKKIKRLKKLIK